MPTDDDLVIATNVLFSRVGVHGAALTPDWRLLDTGTCPIEAAEQITYP